MQPNQAKWSLSKVTPLKSCNQRRQYINCKALLLRRGKPRNGELATHWKERGVWGPEGERIGSVLKVRSIARSRYLRTGEDSIYCMQGWQALIFRIFSLNFVLVLKSHILLFTVAVQSLSCMWLFATPWMQQAKLPCAYAYCLLGLDQTHGHWVSDAIQPSHPLSPTSPPALNLFQLQDLFQWVGSSHQVAKVLELHLQHQSFQWMSRVDLL